MPQDPADRVSISISSVGNSSPISGSFNFMLGVAQVGHYGIYNINAWGKPVDLMCINDMQINFTIAFPANTRGIINFELYLPAGSRDGLLIASSDKIQLSIYTGTPGIQRFNGTHQLGSNRYQI